MQANGITAATVVSLDDPEKLGRVQVQYTLLGEGTRSDWARLVVLMGGKERGTLFRPEEQDEVLLAFEGDARRPFVLGGLWGKTDKPPQTGDSSDKAENDWRLIKSRSGHILKFNDKKGEETLEIIDQTGKRRILLGEKTIKVKTELDGDKIEISAEKGDVKIDAMNVSINAKKDLAITAGGKIKIDGKTRVDIN